MSTNPQNVLSPAIIGSGLNITISAAVVYTSGSNLTSIPSTVANLTANATNYILLNLVSNLIEVNTSGFSGSIFPIATAVTGVNNIRTLADSRPDYFAPISSGGGIGVGTVGHLPSYSGATTVGDSGLVAANIPQTNTQNTYTANQYLKRFYATGTSLNTGSFTLTGWGSGASIGSISGFDQAHTFTITAGSSPSPSPTVRLTFADGAFDHTPIYIARMVGGTGQVQDLTQAANSTTYTITYQSTPSNGSTYIINVLTIGV